MEQVTATQATQATQRNYSDGDTAENEKNFSEAQIQAAGREVLAYALKSNVSDCTLEALMRPDILREEAIISLMKEGIDKDGNYLVDGTPVDGEGTDDEEFFSTKNPHSNFTEAQIQAASVVDEKNFTEAQIQDATEKYVTAEVKRGAAYAYVLEMNPDKLRKRVIRNLVRELKWELVLKCEAESQSL